MLSRVFRQTTKITRVSPYFFNAQHSIRPYGSKKKSTIEPLPETPTTLLPQRIYPTREEVSRLLLDAKKHKKLTFTDLGKAIGRDKVWTAAAMLGHATMDEKEATKLCDVLGLQGKSADLAISVLQDPPMRQAPQMDSQVSSDPTLYRFYEIVHVYGKAMKAVIHEEFGDGIMSAIGFELRMEKQKKDDGDHVIITMDGKFLPYKKW